MDHLGPVASGLHVQHRHVLGPNGRRWAVINGSAYQEGEDVAGLRLVEVREDRARLQRADVTCVLKMD